MFADETDKKRFFESAPEVTEDAVRSALRDEAKRHKYWKANVAKKMIIDSISNIACLHVCYMFQMLVDVAFRLFSFLKLFHFQAATVY